MKKLIAIMLIVMLMVPLSVAYASDTSTSTASEPSSTAIINIVALGKNDEVADLQARLDGKATVKIAAVADLVAGAVDVSSADGIWVYPSVLSPASKDKALKGKLNGLAKTSKPIVFIGSRPGQVLNVIDTNMKSLDDGVIPEGFQTIFTSLRLVDNCPCVTVDYANYDSNSQDAIDKMAKEVTRLKEVKAPSDNSTEALPKSKGKNTYTAAAPWERWAGAAQRNVTWNPKGDYTWKGDFYIIWNDGSNTQDFWSIRSMAQTRPGRVVYEDTWQNSWQTKALELKLQPGPNTNGYNLQSYGTDGNVNGFLKQHNFFLTYGPMSIGLSTAVPDNRILDWSNINLNYVYWRAEYRKGTASAKEFFRINPAAAWRVPQNTNFKISCGTKGEWCNDTLFDNSCVNGSWFSDTWTFNKPQ